ncbi:MAG: hypothetical protein ACRCT6_10175 [Notoacmeibacter sp.]
MSVIRNLAAAVFFLAGSAAPAIAGSGSDFFKEVQGRWVGPGEIVAGKYKGTRFNCDLTGIANGGGSGVDLEGTCRVGVFTQEMKASIVKGGKSYRGTFLDGAKGKGLDIVSGSIEENRVVFAMVREQLKGTMLAKVTNTNQMNVTISVDVAKKMVPVIGMSLKRIDDKATASTGN